MGQTVGDPKHRLEPRPDLGDVDRVAPRTVLGLDGDLCGVDPLVANDLAIAAVRDSSGRAELPEPVHRPVGHLDGRAIRQGRRPAQRHGERLGLASIARCRRQADGTDRRGGTDLGECEHHLAEPEALAGSDVRRDSPAVGPAHPEGGAPTPRVGVLSHAGEFDRESEVAVDRSPVVERPGQLRFAGLSDDDDAGHAWRKGLDERVHGQWAHRSADRQRREDEGAPRPVGGQ